jgi:hypothetical protein
MHYKGDLQAILHLPTNFPIADATEDFALTVIAMDIELGVPNRPDCCAFSVACRRANGQVIRTEFLKTMAYLIYGDHAVRYKLSEGARKQIAGYDEDKGFRPGIYVLRAPKGHWALGADHNVVARKNERKHGPKRPMTYIRGHNVAAA